MKRGEEALEQARENTFRYSDSEWPIIWRLIEKKVGRNGSEPPGRIDLSPLPKGSSSLEDRCRETLEERISFGFLIGYNAVRYSWRASASKRDQEQYFVNCAEGLIRALSSGRRRFTETDPDHLSWLCEVAESARRWRDTHDEFSKAPPRRNRWPLTKAWNAAAAFWEEFASEEVDQSRETIAFLLATARPFAGVAVVTPDAARSYIRDRSKGISTS